MPFETPSQRRAHFQTPSVSSNQYWAAWDAGAKGRAVYNRIKEEYPYAASYVMSAASDIGRGYIPRSYSEHKKRVHDSARVSDILARENPGHPHLDNKQLYGKYNSSKNYKYMKHELNPAFKQLVSVSAAHLAEDVHKASIHRTAQIEAASRKKLRLPDNGVDTPAAKQRVLTRTRLRAPPPVTHVATPGGNPTLHGVPPSTMMHNPVGQTKTLDVDSNDVFPFLDPVPFHPFAPTDTLVNPVVLNDIRYGSGMTQRSGCNVSLISLQLRGSILPQFGNVPGYTLTRNPNGYIRYLVVFDRDPRSVVCTYADVCREYYSDGTLSSTASSFINCDHSSRFVIVLDKTIAYQIGEPNLGSNIRLRGHASRFMCDAHQNCMTFSHTCDLRGLSCLYDGQSHIVPTPGGGVVDWHTRTQPSAGALCSGSLLLFAVCTPSLTTLFNPNFPTDAETNLGTSIVGMTYSSRLSFSDC